MKVFVKTLDGTRFEIEVKPEDTVADVKKNIETVQGGVYPASRQMLIHQGVFLENRTTLEENNVAENNFIVVVLDTTQQSSVSAVTTQVSSVAQSSAARARGPAPPHPVAPMPRSEPVRVSTPSVSAGSKANVYGQLVSTLFSGDNLEATGFRAARNRSGRAGIPTTTENVTVPSRAPRNRPKTTPPPRLPPALPPSTLPQYALQSRDILLNDPQFQRLRQMVLNDPRMLPMVPELLEEIGNRNPQLVRRIQESQREEYLRLFSESPEGGDRNEIPNQLFREAMPQAIQLTPEEHEALGRIEAMGFDRELVLEVFWFVKMTRIWLRTTF